MQVRVKNKNLILFITELFCTDIITGAILSIIRFTSVS